MAASPPEDLRRERLVRGAGVVLDGSAQVIFCDNDYLGLSRDPRLAEAMADAARAYGVGSGASPLITGYTQAHRTLEERLAEFTGRQRALVFPSGFSCNLGVLGVLAGRNDVIVEDHSNHASLLDGARASRARCLRYRHADAAHAAELMSREGAQVVVTDGVFSMDGDTAPLRELAAAAKSAAAVLVCDDAHGLGVLGTHGRGLLEEAELGSTDVPVLVGTLGKAFGAQGGFVAGDADLIEEILQRARSYCYSTALAPPLAAAAERAVRIVVEEPERLRALGDNIAYFRAAARHAGVVLQESRTAIQPVLAGTARCALDAARALARRGLAVRAIRPPTVPEGTSRLRVTLSARHGKEEIDLLAEALGEVLPRTRE